MEPGPRRNIAAIIRPRLIIRPRQNSPQRSLLKSVAPIRSFAMCRDRWVQRIFHSCLTHAQAPCCGWATAPARTAVFCTMRITISTTQPYRSGPASLRGLLNGFSKDGAPKRGDGFLFSAGPEDATGQGQMRLVDHFAVESD